MPVRCGNCGQMGHNRRSCTAQGGGRHQPRTPAIVPRGMDGTTPYANQVHVNNQLRLENERLRRGLERYRIDNIDLTRENQQLGHIAQNYRNLQRSIMIHGSDGVRSQSQEKSKMPKHIADQVWLLSEPECMVCLQPTTEETYALSICGHDYCKRCIDDHRLKQCGVCRKDL